MKRGTPSHPKTVDLAARLNIPRYQAVGILECLWHFTAEFCPQGNIGKFSDAAIAGHIHWDRPCRELIEALCSAKYLDKCSKHRLIVHDWHDHADQTVKRVLDKRGLKFLTSESVTRNRRASTKLADASTELASYNENSNPAGLPLPLPLPIPLPEPMPEPGPGFDFPSWFEARYAKHPKKKERGLAERYAAEAIASGSLIPAEFDPAHDEWCATEAWMWKNGAGAPTLAEFILDKGWKYPPQRAEPAPIDERKRRFLEFAKKQEEQYGSAQS